MEKETLEETAERLVPEAGCELNNSEASYWQQGWISCYIECAKWQQDKVYSDIEQKWNEYRSFTNNEDAWSFKEWLVKQFKKK